MMKASQDSCLIRQTSTFFWVAGITRTVFTFVGISTSTTFQNYMLKACLIFEGNNVLHKYIQQVEKCPNIFHMEHPNDGEFLFLIQMRRQTRLGLISGKGSWSCSCTTILT
uniref:Uncharacterized protein n=1 Tax=Meloidogyne incognita TaxID=6306 RepID=A0A914MNG5_MELIC